MASVFLDKRVVPDAGAVEAALGPAYELWVALHDAIAAEYAAVDEWTYSGKTHGWSLRLKAGKRAILYMTPGDDGFRVAYAFGSGAVAAAREHDLPPAVLTLIDEGRQYAEGRAIRMPVQSRADVAVGIELARIKTSH